METHRNLTEFQTRCDALLADALAHVGKSVSNRKLAGETETYIQGDVVDSGVTFWIYEDGAFAKYIKVPESNLHKIFDIPFEDATFIEPLAAALQTFEMAPLQSRDETVVIIGAGKLGLLLLQVVKNKGRKAIIVGKSHLSLAKELGADHTINVEQEDPVSIIKEITNELGADVVFECSGAPQAQKQAFDIVRRRGKIGLVGLTGREINISLDKIVEGELEVKGSWGTLRTSWQLAIKLISLNKLQVKPLISATLPLEQWEKGFQMMESKDAIKVLLIP